VREYMLTFLSDDRGQGLVEYALIIALVALVVTGALRVLGANGNNSLDNAGSALENSVSPDQDHGHGHDHDH